MGFQGQSSLNAGQKNCRMLHGEHSAILSTFITLPFVIKILVLSIFEWPLKTGFTVLSNKHPVSKRGANTVLQCSSILISQKILLLDSSI